MNASRVVGRLHKHRMWVNRRLLDAARRLSTEELHRPFEIGQGSVWKTLTHLMGAEHVWLEALQGNEEPLLRGDMPGKLPGNQEGEGAIGSLEELIELWRQLDGRWTAYLNALDDDRLEELVYKKSTSSKHGQRLGTRRIDVLLHVCTHAQYTTAQLVNMLRQLGHAPLPDVMLISLARQEAAEQPQPT